MNTRSKRKFCAIWFMLIMIILLSVPVGAEEKQSELICEVLDHDDAYLSEFMMFVQVERVRILSFFVNSTSFSFCELSRISSANEMKSSAEVKPVRKYW